MADRKAAPGIIANQRPEGIFSPTLRPSLGPSAAGSALRVNLCEVRHERRSPAHRLSALQ